ncbi:MAG: hypothetical protein LBO80_02795 [Treponema sp.]|nr:hypothetical protein [Treponema sp.]
MTAADAASGWICLFSLLDKAHCWTFDALKDIYAGLPFPLREFHSDNGSECINHVIAGWHRRPACPILFTRSWDHKKNDNCLRTSGPSRTKNGGGVHGYIGYDRLEGAALQTRLTGVYRSLVPPPQFLHARHEA